MPRRYPARGGPYADRARLRSLPWAPPWERRGLFDRVENVVSDNPSDEQPLYELAARKLTEAAKADPELPKRAQENTQRSACSRA